MGLVEFLGDCGAGKCSHHIVFFYQLLSREEKIKKIRFSKDITESRKTGRSHIKRPCILWTS